ncbi:MAG: hypothetical protein FD143_2246 [Ignavibacteria bacterium]|nr:MAG: hypothetical protein FD143_2246 [Ignavibacteria bacterium]KAF0158531.1 MAG: hypothetical protein FD188_2531 [Ignavibacteria bacterium]
MYNQELVKEILNQILISTERILRRMRPIKTSDDFLKNERSLEKLDSICMQLIALGESIKNLDKITNKSLLKNYPDFEWVKAMGMRDILSHHYFDINNEIVFDVCVNEMPKLKKTVKRILKLTNYTN